MAKAPSGRQLARTWREAQGLTLTAMAHKLGYKARVPYARWESGKGSLPIAKLCALEKITGIPAEDLAGQRQAEEIRLIRGR